MPRELSNHIIPRFYRPPEIILLEKVYNQKVDVWSLGCVFAELLHWYEQQQNPVQASKLPYLFPGKSCDPLSPPTNRQKSPKKKEKAQKNGDNTEIDPKD